MNRFIIAIVLLASLCSARQSLAQDYKQDYKLALGLRLSNSSPTLNNSLSVKYFTTNHSAVEGLLAFGSKFGIGGLLEEFKPFQMEGLSWFYGGGAYLGFLDKNAYIGPTGILGMDYTFRSVPINLSLDWKPELDITPAVHLVPDAFALSVRFTLN